MRELWLGDVPRPGLVGDHVPCPGGADLLVHPRLWNLRLGGCVSAVLFHDLRNLSDLLRLGLQHLLLALRQLRLGLRIVQLRAGDADAAPATSCVPV
jgi:hypothetical protein